jgi:hypothetical protein
MKLQHTWDIDGPEDEEIVDLCWDPIKPIVSIQFPTIIARNR